MSETIYCSQCGASQRPGAKFCRQCGRPVGIAPPPGKPLQPPPSARPPIPEARDIASPPSPPYQEPSPTSDQKFAPDRQKSNLKWVIWIAGGLLLALLVCIAGAAIGTWGIDALLEVLPEDLVGASDVPGVDEPLMIGEIDVQVISVDRNEKYIPIVGGQEYKVTSPDDEFLIVEATVLLETPKDHKELIKELKATVIDEEDRESIATITQTQMDEEVVNSITWAFVVSENSKDFVLQFEGGETIELPK